MKQQQSNITKDAEKVKIIIPKNNKETTVAVSLPDEIVIELVQANELRHYELFLWLVALISPIAFGYLTAFFTENNYLFLWTSIIFFILAGIFLIVALHYRKKVFHGSIRKVSKISDFK